MSQQAPQLLHACQLNPAPAFPQPATPGNAEGARITFNVIKQRMGDVLYKLTSQKFEDPGAFPPEHLRPALGRGSGLDLGPTGALALLHAWGLGLTGTPAKALCRRAAHPSPDLVP